jgi:hypothetical protein
MWTEYIFRQSAGALETNMINGLLRIGVTGLAGAAVTLSAHAAALGDSYGAFCQALGRPGEPIKQVNPLLKQPGWRIWPGQNAKVADLYCDFENERAQIAIYRFRPGGGQFGESEIWRILAFYSTSPWHEERGTARGRIFVTSDLRLSAFLIAADNVLAIAYNSWLLRHFVNKQPQQVKLAARQQHGPAPEPRMDQLPVDRLVPEPQDIFSAVEALSGISK